MENEHDKINHLFSRDLSFDVHVHVLQCNTSAITGSTLTSNVHAFTQEIAIQTDDNHGNAIQV
jgi:hypothetical protein